ncbi:uncharacterized protein N0V89_011720 [Didymosphaeria variabile]|uniref:Uncharacterized protein n=1 Tax=Didymosphaeria variabile TaxID=1932322 RepID=A0A9W9C5K8_9PLEO|nr:uncharacterized protein N0V89_011720 [Didymosphaeria variabile]KAJ4345587.1 hypothetical protein N0V89_011720 [Didymosphaeria variabile]
MCYYRLYIFLGCGHTTLSARPVRPCAAVRSKQRSISHPAKVEQGASLKVPPQGSQPPATLPDDVHTADFAAFHTSHDSTRNTSSHPHTEDANTSQEPVTSRLNPEVDAAADEECEDLLTHPFQTLSIHTSCALCLRRRAALLQQLGEETSTVRFEDWRWKVKYLSPTPEEARYSAEWGNVGSAMGSWVKDWKVKGDEFLGALRDQAADDEGRRDSATGGLGIGIAGMLGPGWKKGKARGKVGHRGRGTSN